jgi:hypothetical protein
MDKRRVDDLRAVAVTVDSYWSRQGRLPASLDELSRVPGVSVWTLDPETGQPYEYNSVSDGTYELCAHFTSNLSKEETLPQNDFW